MRGTLEDIDPHNKISKKDPEVGLRRVPCRGSPEYYLGDRDLSGTRAPLGLRGFGVNGLGFKGCCFLEGFKALRTLLLGF